jgi:sugar phosphate isomerase/epimerase
VKSADSLLFLIIHFSGEHNMVSPITDFSKLCLHTITTKSWTLEECVKNYSEAGIRGITVWRQTLEKLGLNASAALLKESGLDIVSLCRGGFFPGETAHKRQMALDDNRRAIEEAHAIGAPLIVLVPGAIPGMPLFEARKQIQDGIAALMPEAQAANVKLSIEPLHPMYAADRSAVNSLRCANDMAEAINHPNCGVTVDVFHLWWEPELEAEIKRAGKGGYLMSYHICDWRSPLRDMLNDRALMGDGCIDLKQIRGWVEETGFNGFNEVEIFSDQWWAIDPHEFVDKIKEAYLKHS